jgi:O-antigen ligase
MLLQHSPNRNDLSREIIQRRLLNAAVVVLLILPWVNPFAPGPSPAFTPWLVTLVCAAFLVLLAPWITAAAISRAWLAAALLSAVFGLLQYLGWDQAFAPWINQTAVGEAFGNLRQRNQFATLMNIGLAVLIWQGREQAGTRRDWLMLAAAALLAVANAASASRTGLLQLLLLGALGALWGTTATVPARRLVIAATAAYLLSAFLLPLALGLAPSAHGVFARMADSSAPCSSRITLWSNVLHLITLKPWLGWGWGELDYAHFMTPYPGARFCDILDNAHNLPLHLAVELGLPVAVLACAGAAWLVVRARPWRETRPVRQRAWAVLVLLGVHSLLEYPLWYGPFLTACLLCMLMLHKNAWADPAHEAGLLSGIRARIPVAALMLGALTYAAWDYHRVSQIYTSPAAREPAYRDNTLEKIRGSWLFANHVKFAELTISSVTRENAPVMYALATDLLHYSPEPAVVERLIESAVMLGLDDEATVYLARFRAAFPREHEAWAQANLRAVQKAP